MKNIILFGEEVTLDKKIIVTLDNSLKIADLFKDEFRDYTYAGDLKHFIEQVGENKPFIITPLTSCLREKYMELGYDLYVQNDKELICFSELLGYDKNGVQSFSREIRPSQNWEKMLYNHCFNIEVPDIYQVKSNK